MFFDTSSMVTSMFKTTIVINSTISNAWKGARFMGSNIDDYSLAPLIRKLGK